MERYDAYKDSGVGWIGEIPFTWNALKAGRLMSTCSGKPCNTKDDSNGAFYPVYGGGSCIGYSSESNVGAGQIIVGRVGSNEVRYASEDCWATDNALIVVTDICGKYLYYALCSADIASLATSTSQPLLTGSKLKTCVLPLPPEPEQCRIADYLDAETAEIDALVADCEREVELLREYRKAVISEAVTKGLDPNAPMRDSGVEWIGEIPVEWNLMQLGKLCVRIFDGPFGSNLKSNDYVDEGIRVVRLENLKYLQFDATKESYVTPEKYETIKQHTVYPEDLIVATFIIDSVKACRLPRTIGFAVNKADCLGVRTGNDIETDFLKYYLSSSQVYDYLVGLTHGSTRQRINTTQLKALLILLPPMRVQQEIVAYLDVLCIGIDSLIEIKQSMADKLREYRKSLISEAVTGKFKVPGV